MSSEKGAKNRVLICKQLCSVNLEAQSPTEITGTSIAKGQRVIASIVGATRDVGRPFIHRFGFLQLLSQVSTFKNPDAANYARPPADIERILGLDRKG